MRSRSNFNHYHIIPVHLLRYQVTNDSLIPCAGFGKNLRGSQLVSWWRSLLFIILSARGSQLGTICVDTTFPSGFARRSASGTQGHFYKYGYTFVFNVFYYHQFVLSVIHNVCYDEWLIFILISFYVVGSHTEASRTKGPICRNSRGSLWISAGPCPKPEGKIQWRKLNHVIK